MYVCWPRKIIKCAFLSLVNSNYLSRTKSSSTTSSSPRAPRRRSTCSRRRRPSRTRRVRRHPPPRHLPRSPKSGWSTNRTRSLVHSARLVQVLIVTGRLAKCSTLDKLFFYFTSQTLDARRFEIHFLGMCSLKLQFCEDHMSRICTYNINGRIKYVSVLYYEFQFSILND